jgi:hypothetical protein
MITRRQFSKFGLGLTAFPSVTRQFILASESNSSGQVTKEESSTAKDKAGGGKGVHLTIEIPKECFAGIAAKINMIVQNDSDETIIIPFTITYADYEIKVKDSAGHIVPRTRWGDEVLLENKEYDKEKIKEPYYVPKYLSESARFKELSFGERFMRGVTITRLFDLTIAGKYTVFVSRYFKDYPAGNYHELSAEAVLVVEEIGAD